MKSKFIIMPLLLSLTLFGCRNTVTNDVSITNSSDSSMSSDSLNSSDSSMSSDSSASIDAFTITWKNYDNTTLEVDEGVEYGSMPSYDGATPIKDGDGQSTQVFIGWSPRVSAVSGDATYIAKFGDSIYAYTVTWQNYDGIILEVDEKVAYGSMPSYDGATPVRNGDAQYTQVFIGWSPEFRIVEEDITYVARYYPNANNPNEFLLYDEYDNYVVITGLRSRDYQVVVLPISINSKPVTSIGNEAFRDCSRLTSITIPNSVTSIGNSALLGCLKLTSITIPSSVASIGNSAFSYCLSLTSIDVAADNANYSSVDGILYNKSKSTLIRCPGGKTGGSFRIPNSVTFIDNYAFDYCSKLISITIPNSVTSIGNYAFSNCSSLISITIPDSVTSIGESAFFGCSSLTSITIPNSVTSIGDFAFYYCRSLTSIAIPNSVTIVGSGVFSACFRLTSITIPNSVTSIGNEAFRDCSRLTSITIPNSVTSIGSHAFSGCDSLTTITIGNSVTYIGSRAFYNCSSLISITIPDSVTSIGESAFSNCSSLISITIPDSVTSIGESAFSGCSSLTIYVEASSKPEGWSEYWNVYKYPTEYLTVVWGYKG